MRVPKTRYRRLIINDFKGGLNTEKSEFDIAPNEFKVFENLILTYNGVRLRGGFQIEYSFSKRVLAAYQKDGSIYIIFEDGEFGVYNSTARQYSKIGEITDEISIIPKMEWFEPAVILTVGDSIWIYDTLTRTLSKTSSPPAKDLLIKYGRIVIASGDEVWLSGVGDATNWTPDSNDPASAMYFEVGYKEGQNITAINHFLNDILVFKEDKIYQIQDLSAVILLNSKRGAVNNYSTISLMSDVYAIDKNGFYSVVRDRFIDIVAGDLDLKIKSFLKQNIDVNVRIFYSPTLRTFVIKGSQEIFLYFYEYGAWGTLKSVLDINCFTDNNIFLAFGNNVARYNENSSNEINKNYIYEDNEEIFLDRSYIYEVESVVGRLKTKSFFADKLTILGCKFSAQPRGIGYLAINCGKLKRYFYFSDDAIYGDNEEIFSDRSLIFSFEENFQKHIHTTQVVEQFSFDIELTAIASISYLEAKISSMEA